MAAISVQTTRRPKHYLSPFVRTGGSVLAPCVMGKPGTVIDVTLCKSDGVTRRDGELSSSVTVVADAVVASISATKI